MEIKQLLVKIKLSCNENEKKILVKKKIHVKMKMKKIPVKLKLYYNENEKKYQLK